MGGKININFSNFLVGAEHECVLLYEHHINFMTCTSTSTTMCCTTHVHKRQVMQPLFQMFCLDVH